MANQESVTCHHNLVEVIRKELRQSIITEQKNNRETEINRRRTVLGDEIYNKQSWNSDEIIVKAKELRKKPLSIDDYIKLQNSLIQDKANIKIFLSINNAISALIRDLASSNPAIQLAAIHCCCNISVGSQSHCTNLCNNAGPYLVEQLDTLSNPLLEVVTWTIGNLCSGSKNAFKVLHVQGCLHRLLSLLRDCDTTIIPSILYAITHYILGGSELINPDESIKIIDTLIRRNCFDSTLSLWILALLSSTAGCMRILNTILSPLFDKLINDVNDESHDIKQITAIIRIFANLVPGPSASIILNNPKYQIADIQQVFNKLLMHPHIHVRKETLWIIGNLYNHPHTNINRTIKELLPGIKNLQIAIQSVQL